MVTATDKGFSIGADLGKQIDKNAFEKILRPVQKVNRPLNKKRTLRKFLKHLYRFLLLAFGL
jgi:hypothetical protein